MGGKVRLGISDIVHCLPGFGLNRQKPGQYWLSVDSVAFEIEIWVLFSHIQCAWRYWGTNKFLSFDIPNRDDVGLQRVTAFLNLATFVKEQMSLRENFAKLFPKKTFQEKLRFFNVISNRCSKEVIETEFHFIAAQNNFSVVWVELRQKTNLHLCPILLDLHTWVWSIYCSFLSLNY